MCLPSVEESSCRAAMEDSAGVPVQRKTLSSFSDVSQKKPRRNVVFVCGGYYTCQKLKERARDVKQFYLTR